MIVVVVSLWLILGCALWYVGVEKQGLPFKTSWGNAVSFVAIVIIAPVVVAFYSCVAWIKKVVD